MTTTETMKPADQIRAALKAKGISRKQVSVRHHHYSMGSSIKVSILDASVKKSIVEKIAKEQERVDHDTMTGEILCGGNRFVDVKYAAEALAPIFADVFPLLASVKPDGMTMYLCDGEFRAFIPERDPDFIRVLNRAGDEIVRCYNNTGTEYAGQFAARQLAEHIANLPTEGGR